LLVAKDFFVQGLFYEKYKFVINHKKITLPYFLLTFFTLSAIYVLPDSKNRYFARYVLVFAKCVLTESGFDSLSLNHQKTGFYHNFSVLIQFFKIQRKALSVLPQNNLKAFKTYITLVIVLD